MRRLVVLALALAVVACSSSSSVPAPTLPRPAGSGSAPVPPADALGKGKPIARVIVDPYPGDPQSALVSYVFRSTAPYVGLIGGVPDFREKPLVRIAGTDVWYLSARVPTDTRIDYAFVATEGPPEYHVPYRNDRGFDARWKKQVDPNNPLAHFDMSRLELPGAPKQPWIAEVAANPTGKLVTVELTSAILKEKRRVGIYTPPGYDAGKSYPLVVAFDGEVYGLEPNPLIPLPTILDNLLAARKLPPVVLALVANQGTRERDLPGSKEFSDFVATELVPKLRTDYHAGTTAADTILTGSSFGGLCSAFTAFHHADVVGNVLSNSASFQYVPGAIGTDVSPFAEDGWLIREVAAAPRLPIRWYLDTGRFEASLRDANRQMRDVLVAKSYPLTYAEFSGGHDYWEWRGTIANGLIALLAK